MGRSVERGQGTVSEIEQSATPAKHREHPAEVGTVAWVDVRTDSDDHLPGESPHAALAAGFALHRIERAVRGDDRVCPVSTASLAVRFGTMASAVPLDVLGDRLARAVGPSLPLGHTDTGLTVAVGVAGPIAGNDEAQVTLRARSAARSATRAVGPGAHAAHEASTAVTVDLPATGRHHALSSRPPYLTVHRRTARRYGAGRVDGIPTLLPSRAHAGPETDRDPLPASSLCVLVVDPMATAGEPAGYSALTVVSVAERLGCRTATAVLPPDEPLTMAIDGVDVDVVVLVLDGSWVGRSPSWSAGSWGLPARLATGYTDKGVPVLAVSTGAGAGAMAACVAQGALALFTLERLSDALRSLEGFSVEETRQVAELGFPPRFRSLLGLTPGERRVLFYLTEGWSAQDIADELVVSLTTVRSHIRSVLRKLEVRSQLAAVAIANSRDLEDHPVPPGS
jgi:DNA-binding CsgD family transcriptional regulator